MKKNNGFLLVDALITLAIVSSMSLICLYFYRSLNSYTETKDFFFINNNFKLERIFNEIECCEVWQ